MIEVLIWVKCDFSDIVNIPQVGFYLGTSAQKQAPSRKLPTKKTSWTQLRLQQSR